MNMKVQHEIKTKDLLNLMYCLSGEVLKYHGYDEDETELLTYTMIVEYLENLSLTDENIQLLIND
jgi:hypothetical protein